MSRRGKKRDLLAPSLFPFLAVLLCTMGSLVLMLMLEVGQSQATARDAATAKRERTEEIEAEIELVKQSLEKERDQRQLELEKKRLTLQSFEEQIQKSLEELKELARTAELIDDQSTEIEGQSEKAVEKISALEKQLAEAAAKLKQKLEKPTGEKPILAIIPYEGQNGTHRRPVYLECKKEGLVLQPEGVLLSLRDLRPPYGPGNPLDAALRTVRNRYSSASGALNTGAYPLLVVRPSGIQTYALARLAMSGWDDQFGYELIAEEMDLVFPEGEPGLREEIEQSLALARNRQAALILAMPGKYRRFLEELAFESYNPLEGVGDGSGDSLGGVDPSEAGRPAGGSNTLTSFGSAGASTSPAGASSSLGGFMFDGSAVTGSGVNASEPGSISKSARGMSQQTPPTNQVHPPAGFEDSTGSIAAALTSGGSGSFDDLMRQSRSKSNNNGLRGTPTSPGAADPPERHSGAADGTGDPNQRSAPGSTSNLTHQAALSGRDGSGGRQAAATGMTGMEAPTTSSQSPPDMDPTQSPAPSVSLDLHGTNKPESIAKRRGRNWASTGKSAQGTPVVRSIRVVCYRDRWIVFPDSQTNPNPAVIPLNGPLQASAEQLAATIADRVDSWGAALAGGHWKPVLIVDVAYGGQTRFEQLRQLLEGSGVEVQRSAESP